MVSDKKLIEDLKELAEELGHTPTQREMNKHGLWSARTYRRHFGSWNNALKKANIEINKVDTAKKDELLKDLKELAEELGHTPTQREMNKHVLCSARTYGKHFGSWNNAVKEAGLEIVREINISEEKLITELQDFAEELGHTPTIEEMGKKGPHNGETYIRSFGSWNNALKDAGMELNQSVSKESLIKDLRELKQDLGDTPSQSEMDDYGSWHHSTYKRYFGSWNDALREAGLDIVQEKVKNRDSSHIPYGKGYAEARRKCFSRDNYNCRACGNRSNVHCHHIMPRKEFENISNSNTLDNMITLCASCHGKFEGRWKEADPDTFAENAQDYLES